jgi:hypothetical protein
VVGATNKNRDKDEDDSSEMEDGEADEDEVESVDADSETASTVPSAASVSEAGTGHNKSTADVSSWLTKFLRLLAECLCLHQILNLSMTII